MLQEPLSPDDILYEACHIACPVERRQYLDRACGGNARLRDEIEAKAALASRVDEILPESALAMFHWFDDTGDEGHDAAPRENLTGVVLGDYRIVGSLGRGGHLAGTDHRIAELRDLGDAVLPGHTVAVLNPHVELIEVLISW